MGLLDKALELEQSGAGLLRAAEALTQSTDKKKSSSISIAAAIDKIERIDPNSDPVSRAFDILKSTFDISKGAILIYDSAQRIYALRASVGFDRTTENRLRVPEKIAVKNDILGSGNPMRLSGQAIDPFRQFFSMREYGQLESIVLYPLMNEGNLVGIALIAKSGELPENETSSTLMQRIAAAIQDRDKGRVASIASADMEDDLDPEEELDKLIKAASIREKAVILFHITISDAVDYIAATSTHTEPFRIRQDITRILSSLVSGIGLLVKQSTTTLLLAITTRKTTSAKLFAHQITQAIRTFFKDVGEDLPLVPQSTVRFPDDGETAKALLSHWE